MRIVPFLLVLLLFACAPDTSKKATELDIKPNEKIAEVNLTVAEGKRLIAKGICNRPDVKRKLKSGIIVITRGTTNTYIAEEMAGLSAEHGQFVTGRVTPSSKSLKSASNQTSEIVLIDGKKVELSYIHALHKMSNDDIIFKGANMLNYELKQAAVCIGHKTGGTTGAFRPYINKNKIKLIVPIGLEKQVWGDLEEYEQLLKKQSISHTGIPKVWVHQRAEIFTEIEAMKTFGKVEVIPFAAGGIAGREGGISLAVYGDSTEVNKVIKVVSQVQGEKLFIIN
ncbi:MAG: hypothetical protein GZ091_08345 [Paludibacter sp.]|nr:hypothetical protein [Paludibacter sp.]